MTPSTSTPAGKSKAKKGGKVDDGMDEVDRALAELDMKAGQSSTGTTGPTTVAAANAATASTLGLRQLLSVDPKNLDADAELRRFFGSKVVSLTVTPISSLKVQVTYLLDLIIGCDIQITSSYSINKTPIHHL